MVEDIVQSVRAKEKDIVHSISFGSYIIKGVGSFARVTNVLKAVNFDNGTLLKWQNKMAVEKFKSLVPSTGTVDAKFVHDSFTKALDAGNEFAKHAADFGTLVHSWLENFALTGTFPQKEPAADSPYYTVFHSVKQFISDFGLGTPSVTVIKPELFVYHTLGYAGTADLVVMRNNKVYLIDYKATNHLKSSYLLQLAAYTAAIKELYGLDVEKATLIRFGKQDVGYERLGVSKEELAVYFEIFKKCMMFYKFIQNPSYRSVKELFTPEHLKEITEGLL